MSASLAIDYVGYPHDQRERIRTHFSDDPVEAEEFLMHRVAARARIVAIRQEGAALAGNRLDRLLKIAADLLGDSLGLDAERIKDRCGFAA